MHTGSAKSTAKCYKTTLSINQLYKYYHHANTRKAIRQNYLLEIGKLSNYS